MLTKAEGDDIINLTFRFCGMEKSFKNFEKVLDEISKRWYTNQVRKSQVFNKSKKFLNFEKTLDNEKRM